MLGVKPIIKLALVGLLVAGVGYAYTTTTTVPPAPPPLPDGAAYTIKTGYVGGGEPGQVLPLIVLMPADGSSAEEALDGLKSFDRPARVITIEGRFQAFGKFYWIDPAIESGPEYGAAVKAELERLVNVVKAVVKDASPARAVVIGHGFAGSMAVGLGFRLPALVRQAWGTGGTVEMSWVPEAAPALGDLKGPMLRKLSWREPGYEEKVAEKATQHGWDMKVTPLVGKPNSQVVFLWLMKDLALLLDAP